MPRADTVINLLFICKGNICRSPLAEAIVKKDAAGTSWRRMLSVRSAGTENYNIGKPAHKNIIKIADEHGYDLSRHRARQASISDINWASMIIAMDRENMARLNELFSILQNNRNLRLLMSFTSNNKLDVQDPYRQSYDKYQTAYRMIKEGCQCLLDYILGMQNEHFVQ